jgi:hypothetical protein
MTDDQMHAPGTDRRWRESYYFSFFDVRHRIGGFSSIGKRAASRHSGSINVIWGPDRPSLVASELDKFDVLNDDHDVSGLTYRAHEPFGVWEIAFEGRLNVGGNGVECAREALGPAGGNTVPVRYELTFTPSFPPYVYRERPEWSELFTGHVDEVGAVRGTLTVGGKTWEIDGRGGKDHSWGVRNWFAPAAWRWLDLISDGGPQLTLWRAVFRPGEWVCDGAVFTDSMAALNGYAETLSTENVPDRPKPLPSSLRAEITAGGITHGLTGEVRRVLPVLFTKDGQVSWNDRALVECFFDSGPLAGRTGWANAEFAERVREP